MKTYADDNVRASTRRETDIAAARLTAYQFPSLAMTCAEVLAENTASLSMLRDRTFNRSMVSVFPTMSCRNLGR